MHTRCVRCAGLWCLFFVVGRQGIEQKKRRAENPVSGRWGAPKKYSFPARRSANVGNNQNGHCGGQGERKGRVGNVGGEGEGEGGNGNGSESVSTMGDVKFVIFINFFNLWKYIV